MAAQIIPFQFKTSEIRTVVVDDQLWFFAMDVCSALQLRDTNKALIGLDEDEKCEHEQYSGSGRKPVLINESGLYSLILRSRKAEAKVFKKWVTAEVLPSIRKHGRYDGGNEHMKTLLSATIGTTGFNCLAAVLEGKVKHLPAAVKRQAKQHIWAQVHKAFSVVSAQDIPANQMDAARAFVGSYAIEGEYLPRGRHHFPSSYWKRFPLPGLAPERGAAGIPEHYLYGAGLVSPLVELLAELEGEGQSVEACRQELDALRYHLARYVELYQFGGNTLAADLATHYQCMASHMQWIANRYREDLKPALEHLGYQQRHNMSERMVAVLGQAIQIERLLQSHGGDLHQ